MPQDQLTPPERIGPYRVIRPIAQGGMAAVFEVEDEGNSQRLALKLLTQRGLAGPRFNREYRALTRLDHPHIVRVYRFGVSKDDEPFLTMELLEGVPAQVYAKSKGRPGTPARTAEVVRVVSEVADALSYMHAREIVHRDLKSSNVMVLDGGTTKLLDFGTARLLDTQDEITRHGEFVGTFAYASPEQLTGGQVDPRSDIYSLGVLFYRLLTGKRPFEADSPHALARQHLEYTPRPPGQLIAGIPADVSDIVMRMLAKTPEERPGSAAEVAAMLRGEEAPPPRDDAVLALSAPKLVGRDKELAALQAVIQKAKPGRMVVLSGPAGSGRRRLLDQAVRQARSDGLRVYEGQFPGAPGLGALGEVARKVARGLPVQGGGSDPDLAVLADVPVGEMPGSSMRVRIYQAISSIFFRRVSRSRQSVALVLQELHRAPPLAVQALRVLRQHAAEANVPIVVLVSASDEGDGPQSTLRRHFHDATRISLGPLNPVEVGQLVGSMLGRKAPPPILCDRIHAATGGMPGYIEEVVRSMVHQGMVQVRRAPDARLEWLDRSAGRIAIPGTVREVISLRIDGLPRHSLRVLEALAVVGGEASLTVLAHAVEKPVEVVADALHHMGNEGLLAEHPEASTWRFRLGLTQQLVAERTRASRRYVLQRRLSDVLKDTQPSAAKIRLLVAAGELARAARDAVEWARTELDDSNGGTVLAVLDRVVSAITEADGIVPECRSWLHLLHGRAMGMVDPQDDRATAALDLAEALCEDPVLGSEVDLERATNLRRRGVMDGSAELMERALARLESVDAPKLEARIRLDQGAHAVYRGDFERALQGYELAAAAAGSCQERRIEGEGRVGAGICRHAMGQLTAAAGDFERASAAFGDIGDDGGLWHASLNLADLYRLQGRFSESLQVVERHLDAARTSNRAYRYAGLLVNLAETQIDLFRLGEVRELLNELDRIGVASAHPYTAAARALVRGRLQLASREPASALALLEPARAAADAAGLPVLALQLGALMGEAQGGLGNLATAERLTREALEGLAEAGHVPMLAEACVARSRALGDREDPDETFRPVLGWLENEPARVVRLQHLLASADFAAGRGAKRRAFVLYRSAEESLDQIGRLLSGVDRAALAVHPWRVRIQRSSYL